MLHYLWVFAAAALAGACTAPSEMQMASPSNASSITPVLPSGMIYWEQRTVACGDRLVLVISYQKGVTGYRSVVEYRALGEPAALAYVISDGRQPGLRSEYFVRSKGASWSQAIGEMPDGFESGNRMLRFALESWIGPSGLHEAERYCTPRIGNRAMPPPGARRFDPQEDAPAQEAGARCVSYQCMDKFLLV